MHDEDKSREQLISELRELRKHAPRSKKSITRGTNGEEAASEYVPRRLETDPGFLSARLISAQEQERKRIAAELHDSLGSFLTAIKISLENTRNRMAMGETDPALVENSIYLTQLAIQEVRGLIMDLRPSMLDDLGLIATLNWYCRQFQAVCSNVIIDKKIGVEEEEIPEELKIVIFRVLQEAFQNIAKYSSADYVEISLVGNDGFLELSISDHGEGFDIEYALSRANGDKGVGLTIMKERTELSGGSFSINSTSGQGTSIRILWPKSDRRRRVS